MTKQQLEKAANTLLNTLQLTGGDDPKYLPKIFIVNGQCSLFLNAARRLAYGTSYPIEVMTIEEAWEIHTGLGRDTLKKDMVQWEFDQIGDTFGGRLFCANRVLASAIPNPVIKLKTGAEDPMAHVDDPVNLMFFSSRAQNIMTRIGCRTYRDLLKASRDTVSKLRNVGSTTIAEFDAEMDRVGLWNQWKFNKPINA